MSKPWSDWDLEQWLVYLEHKNTVEIQLGLERVKLAAAQLNLDKLAAKVITIAGTNGKGSTVAALEALYCTAGYKVGAYTSPHLIHFNERIRINQLKVSDGALCQTFALIEDACSQIKLTYFEIATLAALVLFKQHHLDVILLEVGLGGRLDACNVIDADVAIITTIDYDHQDFLGNTLEAIGYEKAGILRAGKPFIYADSKPPQSILSYARELGAKSVLYGHDYSLQQQEMCWSFSSSTFSVTNLPEPHIQLKSAAAALQASILLQQDLPVTPTQIHQAFTGLSVPARLQFVGTNPRVLYDVAHNPQAARLLAQTIKNQAITGKVHAVFSALKDKDISGLIEPLKSVVDHWYPAQLDTKRAVSSDKLLLLFQDAELFPELCYNSPHIAFIEAQKRAQLGDLIVVFGSFFTVSQIMAAQHKLLEPKEI